MKTMGILVIATFGWTAIYWLGSLMIGGETRQVSTWTADVQFVFAGADRGEYPNGLPFAASDLISPAVLERVIVAVDELPEDIDAATLGSMLAVAAHFPDAEDLRRDYRARLGNDLSLAETRELERAFARDFERGASRRARLFLTNSREDLPVVALLQAIPAVWADYMRSDYGVFRTNRTLYGADAVRPDMFTGSDPLMVYLVLRQQIQLLKDNIETLEEEPNSGNAHDPQSNLGLADIQARVGQFEELVLESQLSQVLEAAVYQNPEQALRFLDIRMARQGQELALLQSKSAAVENALSDYDVDQFAPLDGAAGGMGAGGEDFLNRLIALGIEGGDLGFRQELTRERLDFELEAAVVASDRQRLSALLRDLNQDWQSSADSTVDPDIYMQNVAVQLTALVGSVRNLFEVMERLTARLDELRYGEDGRMINLGQISAEPKWTSGRFTQVYWHWYLLSLLAVVIAAALFLLGLKLLLGSRSGARK